MTPQSDLTVIDPSNPGTPQVKTWFLESKTPGFLLYLASEAQAGGVGPTPSALPIWTIQADYSLGGKTTVSFDATRAAQLVVPHRTIQLTASILRATTTTRPWSFGFATSECISGVNTMHPPVFTPRAPETLGIGASSAIFDVPNGARYVTIVNDANGNNTNLLFRSFSDDGVRMQSTPGTQLNRIILSGNCMRWQVANGTGAILTYSAVFEISL